MRRGLQFNPVQEARFALWHARESFMHNRSMASLTVGVFIVWVLWLLWGDVAWQRAWLIEPIGSLSQQIAFWQVWLLLASLSAGVLLCLFWLPWLAGRNELICALLCLLLQSVLVVLSFQDLFTALSPLLLLPLLLPVAVFRMRFVVALPLTLLLWLSCFLSINFTLATSITEFTHWITLSTGLMICLLALNYQLEQLQRRLFLTRENQTDNPVLDHREGSENP